MAKSSIILWKFEIEGITKCQNLATKCGILRNEMPEIVYYNN